MKDHHFYPTALSVSVSIVRPSNTISISVPAHHTPLYIYPEICLAQSFCFFFWSNPLLDIYSQHFLVLFFQALIDSESRNLLYIGVGSERKIKVMEWVGYAYCLYKKAVKCCRLWGESLHGPVSQFSSLWRKDFSVLHADIYIVSGRYLPGERRLAGCYISSKVCAETWSVWCRHGAIERERNLFIRLRLTLLVTAHTHTHYTLWTSSSLVGGKNEGKTRASWLGNATQRG
jgi:hypothetical protein